MYKLNLFFDVLNEYAPISISEKMIENGSYDNSGIIIEHHDYVNKVLFSLDLSIEAVKKAKRNNCDTIVTHHPAIYNPIKNLSYKEPNTASILLASSFGMNVISMHLNLDMATKGIDHYLSLGLGGKDSKIIDCISDGIGYGREFFVNDLLGNFTKKAKKEFNTNKIIVYGKSNTFINKVASFCGSGGSSIEEYLEKGKLEAELLITSDLPHNLIKNFIERGKCLMIIPHYVSEEYGFKYFKEYVSEKTKIQSLYFDDKRFR